MAMLINKNHADDLRVVQRIKFDQALYILTMYEKKIREKDQNLYKDNFINNADECQGKIIQAWKKKWQSDLTKPILTCVLSVYPRIISKKPQLCLSQDAAHYYTILNTFIERMKIQHEDETNYKLVLELQVPDSETNVTSLVSKTIIFNTFMMIDKINNLMKQSWIETSQQIEDNIDYDVNYYRFLKKNFDYITTVINHYQIINHEIECPQQEILQEFVKKMITIMDRLKDSDHGCTLFGIQPMIEHLTYLIHPILIAIQGHFLKDIYQSNIQKNVAFNIQSVFTQGSNKTLIDIMKNNAGSKVVFINLDGFESDFNLEFARNLKRNLMYISFPKENNGSEMDQYQSKQFYKKLMFNLSETNQSKNNLFNRTSQLEDTYTFWMEETFLNDPQHYHQNAKKFYPFTKYDDINQNVYVLPIRSTSLKKQFSDILELDADMEAYQSHFVRFLLRDFLVNQIRQFNPTFVIISYSGRINIEQGHFIQICQQLTKVATYKLILFPNFTTTYCSDLNETDEDGEPIEYTFVNDSRIGFTKKEEIVDEFSFINVNFLDRIARFLKVGSGTYNLTRSFQEQTYLSKYKNQMALRYTDELMEVLSKEYSSIDRIKFRNKDLSILPKLFQDKVNQLLSTNSIVQTVPPFYMKLYLLIENLIFRKQAIELEQFKVYQKDIKMLYDIHNIKQQNGIFYGLEQFKKVFKEFRDTSYIQISGEKISDRAYVYIRTEEKQTQKSLQNLNFGGLCSLKFILYSKDLKQDFKIYESTSLLYRSDRNTINANSKTFPLLIMNHLDQKGQYFTNYLLNIQKSDITPQNSKTIASVNIPINQNNIIKINHKITQKPFVALSQWNFAETQNYIVLFWPSQYDLIKHALAKLSKKTFEPKILNLIFISNKFKNPNIFEFVQTYNNDICPRVGCSVYQMSGKLFIFGGFYEREKNYLQLQHDITTFDLGNWSETHKVEVSNIKRFLYSPQTTEMRIKRGEGANSYVRPRMEFEFYQINELQREDNAENKLVDQDQQFRKVIMFGGYGQNFIRPYSLLTYYYYELTFDNLQRKLTSLQKKIIYGKAVPINTKNVSKNLGIIKMYKKLTDNNNQQQFKQDFTSPDSSALCRFKYFLRQKSFQYKFKYAFSDDQFNLNKGKVRQIFDQKTEGIINTQISIIKFEGNSQHNNVIFCKDDKKITVPLTFQLPSHIAAKLDKQVVSLNHQSIISLSIPWDNYIYCIIQHPIYTSGKCVLAEFNISSLQNIKFTPQDITSACLRTVEQFKQNLSMNILQSNNATKIVIFHGERLIDSDNIAEYFIHKKLKPEKVNCFKIEPRIRQVNQTYFDICYSIFFSASAKIRSFDFISNFSSNIIYLSIHDLDINKPQDNKYQWIANDIGKLSLRFSLEQQNHIPLSKLKFIKMSIAKDWDQSRDKQYTQKMHLWIEYNIQKYVWQFSLEELLRNTKTVTLRIASKYIHTNYDNQEMSYAIIHKTIDKYIDKGFIV